MKLIHKTYTRNEKLKKRSHLKLLFEKGNRNFHYPFQMVYLEFPLEDSWVEFGVSVRKRDFKKAVDRNRLKRLMRECFRLHKNELRKAFQNEPHLVMLVYVGKQKMAFSEMEKNYLELLKQL